MTTRRDTFVRAFITRERPVYGANSDSYQDAPVIFEAMLRNAEWSGPQELCCRCHLPFERGLLLVEDIGGDQYHLTCVEGLRI